MSDILISLIPTIVLLVLIAYGASRLGLVRIDWTVNLKHIAIGAGLLLGIPILCTLIMVLVELMGRAAVRSPLPFVLAGIAGVLAIAVVMYRTRRKEIQSNRSVASSQNLGGRDRCVKCGRAYAPSLAIGGQSVRVATCSVCPANHVYTVCEHCADLNMITQSACPWCGAKHLWRIEEMEPA
jgi:hypothetical protein